MKSRRSCVPAFVWWPWRGLGQWGRGQPHGSGVQGSSLGWFKDQGPLAAMVPKPPETTQEECGEEQMRIELKFMSKRILS